jgi:hypothetical protein
MNNEVEKYIMFLAQSRLIQRQCLRHDNNATSYVPTIVRVIGKLSSFG